MNDADAATRRLALLSRAQPWLEHLLAAQGDGAAADLIALQHALAAELQPPGPLNPEPPKP